MTSEYRVRGRNATPSRMIIGSWDWQEIGSTQSGFWDAHPGIRQLYLVLRQATHEEWLAEASANAKAEGRPFDMNHPRCTFYFEISMD